MMQRGNLQRGIQAGLLLLILLVMCGCAAPYKFRGTEADSSAPTPDFTLTDTEGQPFQLSAQKGKVTLLYFGYTRCPDYCPLTLSQLAQARQALGSDASHVQTVFVTVDPDNDTADVLKQYLSHFDASAIGLRGTTEQLLPVYKTFFVEAAKSDGSNGTAAGAVDHSTFVYVLDRNARWRVLYSQPLNVDDLVSDVRHLVHE